MGFIQMPKTNRNKNQNNPVGTEESTAHQDQAEQDTAKQSKTAASKQ